MHWYDGNGMGWMGYLVMGLVMTVLWAGVAATLIMLVRRPAHGARSDPAERILAERLAKGDIDSGEYNRVRQVLRTRLISGGASPHRHLPGEPGSAR